MSIQLHCDISFEMIVNTGVLYMLFKRNEKINTYKRLPMVVVIDSAALKEGVTSVGDSKYDIAMNIVNRLLYDIQNDRKLHDAVEICFINNDSELRNWDFIRADECIFKSAEMCTFSEDMIQFAYEKMLHRIKWLQEVEISYYTPLIIFIGDEEFQIDNNDVYKEKHVFTIVINIGKTTGDPIEGSNIEVFSVGTKAIAERFGVSEITQYITDGHPNDDLNEVKCFHNYCGALREKLNSEKDTTIFARIEKDENDDIIQRIIGADMDALLADLARV